MTRRLQRGSTLIELILTVMLSALILGVAVTLYAFIAARTADSVNRFSTLHSCNALSREIGGVISNSISVSIENLSGGNALACTMPADGVDRDQDGMIDQYLPYGTDKLGREAFRPGKIIWFYRADNTGDSFKTGNYWFKAVCDHKGRPTLADIDRQWSFWNNDLPRVLLQGSVTFAPIAGKRLTRVQIVTSGTVDSEDAGLTRSRRGTLMDVNQCFYWRSL